MDNSKLTIKDLDPIFADGKLPDYPVELFADGQPATITWKWNFVRHAEEDDEQPAEGTNHLRIDVNSEWLPLDEDNLPRAKDGWCLLAKWQSGDTVYSFNTIDNEWEDTDGDVLQECYNLDEVTYKLIKI
jgi:hypothetical protein